MRAAKHFFPFLCVALSFVISAQFLQAKAATGNLEGTVLDSQGRPLSGALVTIQASYGAHPHVTHTDASGHFEFSHFAAGQYDLRAYYSGSFRIGASACRFEPQRMPRLPCRSQRQSVKLVGNLLSLTLFTALRGTNTVVPTR